MSEIILTCRNHSPTHTPKKPQTKQTHIEWQMDPSTLQGYCKRVLLVIPLVLQCFLQFAPTVPTRSYELLNKMKGNGLSVTYRFTRTISIFSPKMVSIELSFTNESDSKVSGIRIGEKVELSSVFSGSLIFTLQLSPFKRKCVFGSLRPSNI